MRDLPDAWAWAQLGDVVDVLDHLRVPVNRAERAERVGRIPYYGATGQVGWIDEPLFNVELCLLGEDGAPFFDLARAKAYVIDGPSWVNNHAHVLRARDCVTTRFLKYALDQVDYRPFVTGTTRAKLTKSAMSRIPVPVPPLAEQRRIVAAIEEHLSRLEAADANLESGRRRIEKLRDVVRDSLVDPDWPHRPLGELLREPLRNGVSAKTSPTGSTRIITLTAVTTGEFSERNSKLADVDSSRTKGLWLEPGDVLIERSNTPELVGTAALFDGPGEWAIFPDLLIRVRPSAELLPEYLNLVLSTSTVRRYFQRAAQGISGSMPKIDQGAVLRLAVPTPPTNEQVRAVERATVALAGCKQLESATAVSNRQVASLRRSILARAFRGELVPQDTRDEPASVLLERIAAERTASSTKKTRTRQVRTPA